MSCCLRLGRAHTLRVMRSESSVGGVCTVALPGIYLIWYGSQTTPHRVNTTHNCAVQAGYGKITLATSTYDIASYQVVKEGPEICATRRIGYLGMQQVRRGHGGMASTSAANRLSRRVPHHATCDFVLSPGLPCRINNYAKFLAIEMEKSRRIDQYATSRAPWCPFSVCSSALYSNRSRRINWGCNSCCQDAGFSALL
ncbi:hypothetical protein FN846DRAFT_956015 [Sphaerosporella brunnea]|uniref:Uncharacterized protein n=1 Tax=Sphaerosporella brunnea TaxID=1250544 RepID=A0A5J5ESU7_9PEZI|nr:hypothetical protein FN846DRAFT_956015 [Sphaerosporella brunnea]